MKGSIRFIVGMLLTFGAVGGIENSVANTELAYSVLVAIVGVAIMASGVNALKGNQNA